MNRRILTAITCALVPAAVAVGLLAGCKAARQVSETPIGTMPADAHGIALSKDGLHIAYAAPSDSRKWFIAVDGKPGPAHDGFLVGGLVLSPDGKRAACVVSMDRDVSSRVLVMVDDQPGPEYDAIGEGGNAGHFPYFWAMSRWLREHSTCLRRYLATTAPWFTTRNLRILPLP